MFTVREWSCRALSNCFFIPVLFLLHQLSPPSSVGSVACVCVGMCGEQVCHVSFVCGEWDEAHRLTLRRVICRQWLTVV